MPSAPHFNRMLKNPLTPSIIQCDGEGFFAVQPFCRLKTGFEPVFHKRMSHVTEARLISFAFLVECDIRVGARGERVVLALLALEISSRVLPTAWIARIIPRNKALPGCPSLDQRPAHRV
ncbi:MAG: hypothetical protein FWH15_04035 [Betaproteobacteria bacterium]|nr:hypothetical protein [Betaproteobacteria bacterium]